MWRSPVCESWLPTAEEAALESALSALRNRIFRSFTTNGLALDPMFETVVASAPDKVHVSIHFPNRDLEVARAIRQVRALHDAGVSSGINLLVRASQLPDAIRCGARLRASGIGNDRIVYLPIRRRRTSSDGSPAADNSSR